MNRGLTRAEAEAGVIPEPMTLAEWQALHDAALIEEGEALQRTFDARVKAEVRADEKAKTCACAACMRDRRYEATALLVKAQIDADMNQHAVESRPSEDA